jgi:glycosyltransferase involved in cell wall biosynthesis
MEQVQPDRERTTPVWDKVSIVLPAYNEAPVIGRVLEALRQQDYHEIIVVDDGSTDDTAAVARKAGVTVLQHAYNIGNGAAVKTGIRAATGDGQHDPNDVPRLLSHVGKYDMVVGARTAMSEAQRHRTVANKLFNRYASYIVDHPVEDLTSGFRAAKAEQLKKFVYLLPNGFSYPTTITIAMFRSGFSVRYEPINAQARVGKSKIRPVRDGLRFLLTITRLATFFVPMKVFLPISLLLFVIGVGYGGYLILFMRRFSNMAALFVMAGLMVFLIGLISEQLALLRLQHSND